MISISEIAKSAWNFAAKNVKRGAAAVAGAVKNVFVKGAHCVSGFYGHVKYKAMRIGTAAATVVAGVQARASAAVSLGEGSAFFTTAIDTMQVLVIALGIGLGVWGIINLMEGYGQDNPGAKSQGIKQLMAGAGVAVVGAVLVPLMKNLFS